MTLRPTLRWLIALGAAASIGACASAGREADRSVNGAPAGQAPAAAIAEARADSARYPYTQADIHFMTMMIGHHAQAVVMSRWAPTHGATPAIQRLAERIINAQQDEIRSMQAWLRARRQPVPDPVQVLAAHGAHHGAQHGMRMKGMLSAEQMAALDAARGEEFDRLFLSFMIQHHSGAVEMVKDLFATPGAAQDETVFKLASDINVDQLTEIARMRKMLIDATFGPAPAGDGGARP